MDEPGKDPVVIKPKSRQGEAALEPSIRGVSFKTIFRNFHFFFQTTYSLSKRVKYTTATKYPLWRWKNFYVRTWAYFCDKLFLFSICSLFFLG